MALMADERKRAVDFAIFCVKTLIRMTFWRERDAIVNRKMRIVSIKAFSSYWRSCFRIGADGAEGHSVDANRIINLHG